MHRTYNIKICKINIGEGFFITGCYNIKISTHLKRLLKFYNDWRLDLTNRKSYQPIFGFFEKYGVENIKIKCLCVFIGTNTMKKQVIDYLLDGLKDYKNCFNINNNIYKKYRCFMLKLI